MQKQGKQLLILALALVVLAGAYLGVRQYNRAESQKPAQEEEQSILLADISDTDVISFTYDYEGETNTFEKEEDTWYYAEDHELKITQYRMTTMLSRIAPLKAKQKIENVTDLSQYGLDKPAQTVSFSTAQESHTIQIGDYNSSVAIYYFLLDDDPTTVYVSADSYLGSGFNYSLENLIEEEESVSGS